MKNNKTNIRGFTLIELLLYLGILTIAITAIVPFAWTVIQMGQKSAVQQEVFNNARYVSEKLKRQIRDAKNADTANSNFDVNLALNPANKITLILPSPDTSAVISVANGQVKVIRNGTTTEIWNSNGSKVTEMTFTNYSSGKAKNVGFTITMQGASTSTSKTYYANVQLKSSTEMRN